MRRKKDPQTPSADPAKFWPVPGVDGEPYPPRVQEALDLIAKETKRLKIRECKHEGRYPTTRFDRSHRRSHHVCACLDCGADRIACIPTMECNPRMRRTEVYGVPYDLDPTIWRKTEEQERREIRARTDRMVSRQIQRASAQFESMERDTQDLQRETERVRKLREGAMARSTGGYVVHNALGEPVVIVPADDRAPDLSWIRTMSGKERLR